MEHTDRSNLGQRDDVRRICSLVVSKSQALSKTQSPFVVLVWNCRPLRHLHALLHKQSFEAQRQEWPRQTKPKKGQFMNFSQGHSRTKIQCESCLFSQGKTPEFTKMGEIYELLVLPLSLVGLPGRLLTKPNVEPDQQYCSKCSLDLKPALSLHMCHKHHLLA